MSERISEIRARLDGAYIGIEPWWRVARQDIAYLLDRVEALEKRVESLQHGWKDA
jgi:hypothetical protein